jgi:asparagine synthetase B (glutamine-hydrolysing)
MDAHRRGVGEVVSGMEDVTFGPDQQGVDHVLGALSRYRRVGVAYSGGVDSAALLALAVRALGADRVVGGLPSHSSWRECRSG